MLKPREENPNGTTVFQKVPRRSLGGRADHLPGPLRFSTQASAPFVIELLDSRPVPTDRLLAENNRSN